MGDEELSRLLFDARELVDTYGDHLKYYGLSPDRAREVRDGLDAYRAERGWTAHGEN